MNALSRRERRTYRTRRNIRRPVDNGRLRLSVFRSARYIYAQLIDDDRGVTVAEANSKSLGLEGNKTDQAKEVGKVVAERAKAAGVTRVVFAETELTCTLEIDGARVSGAGERGDREANLPVQCVDGRE